MSHVQMAGGRQVPMHTPTPCIRLWPAPLVRQSPGITALATCIGCVFEAAAIDTASVCWAQQQQRQPRQPSVGRSHQCSSYSDQQMLLPLPPSCTHPLSHACDATPSSIWQVVVPGPGSATMQREFAFHACLGPGTSQAEVMQLCGIHQLLDAALAGYHVTILAYGQTGGWSVWVGGRGGGLQ
jgi:hypothetical protein